MDFYYKNIKREHNDFPHTFSPITSSLTSLSVNMQMNKHYFFRLFLAGSPSIRWPFCAEVVSNWFQALSFGLLLLLLLDRSLGNNTVNARGARGRWEGGRSSCPYLCPRCKRAGTKPEYRLKQQCDRLDSMILNWTGLRQHRLNWTSMDFTALDWDKYTGLQ